MTRPEAALRALATPIPGDPFEALAQRLAETAGVRCALIAECVDAPPTRVRTLAFWHGERLIERFEYGLDGTPCAEVVGGTECFFPSGVTQTFPHDTDLHRLEAESYLGVPLSDAGGTVVGHLAVLDDKPMEEDLPLRRILRVFAVAASLYLDRRRADAAAAGERDLAGSVAHAIGNPLTALIGSLELALDGAPESEGEVALSRTLRLAQRIRAVTERTLLLCREGRVQRRPQDAGAILRTLTADLVPRAQRQGVRIELHCAPGLEPVTADASLLGAALAAVAENALDAMSDGGTLRLEVRATDAGAAFEVSDSGPGIPARLRERIFEPFVTTKSGGTGLGLSIARRVVDAHGGRVRVEQPSAGGARVVLEIP